MCDFIIRHGTEMLIAKQQQQQGKHITAEEQKLIDELDELMKGLQIDVCVSL